MPKIAVYKYLAFFIVAYDLSERLHLHVIKSKGGYRNVAKIWMDPVEISDRGDLTDKEINLIMKLITRNEARIKENISKFAEGQKIKPILLK